MFILRLRRHSCDVCEVLTTVSNTFKLACLTGYFYSKQDEDLNSTTELIIYLYGISIINSTVDFLNADRCFQFSHCLSKHR